MKEFLESKMWGYLAAAQIIGLNLLLIDGSIRFFILHKGNIFDAARPIKDGTFFHYSATRADLLPVVIMIIIVAVLFDCICLLALRERK